MSMKAETKVMLLQVKEYKLLPESPEAMWEAWEQAVLTAVRRNQAGDTLVLDFSFPGLGDSKFLLLSTWILVSAAAPENSCRLGRVFEPFVPSIVLQCWLMWLERLAPTSDGNDTHSPGRHPRSHMSAGKEFKDIFLEIGQHTPQIKVISLKRSCCLASGALISWSERAPHPQLEFNVAKAAEPTVPRLRWTVWAQGPQLLLQGVGPQHWTFTSLSHELPPN